MTPGKLYKIKANFIVFYEGNTKYYLYKDDIIFVYFCNMPTWASAFHIIKIMFKNKSLVRNDMEQCFVNDWFEELC